MKCGKSAARRRGLFMGGSSVGALLLAVAFPTALSLAPTAAHAFDECGVQAANGDPIVCAPGAYPGISYPGSIGGVVPVTLQDGVSVYAHGFQVGITLGGAAAESVSLDAAVANPGAGDLYVYSDFIGIALQGRTVSVDFTDEDDAGDFPGLIEGGIVGVTVNAGDGGANINIGNVRIFAIDQWGFNESYGVSAISQFGPLSISGTGDITSQYTGIRTLAQDGQTTINVGRVIAGGAAIRAEAVGGGGVDITTNGVITGYILGAVKDGDLNITSLDVVESVTGTSEGGGSIAINTLGDVSGVISANVLGSGSINISAAAVSGGISAETLGGGSANIQFGSSGWWVTAHATGGGSASISGGDVNGNVQALADGLGNANVSTGAVTGVVNAGAFGSGSASVNTNGGIDGGIVAFASGGDVNVSAAQDVSDGIWAATTGTGAVTVVAANVTSTGTPIFASSDSGDVSVTLNGTVSGNSGFLAEISTAGSATIGIGAGVTASQADFDLTFGEMLTINNGGTWTGAIDFSAATAGHFNNSGDWAAEDITFTDGDDTFANSGTATFDGSRTYDFMGGADSATNSGEILIGTALTLENLETFTNSGAVVIGTDEGAATLALSDATAVTSTGTIVFGGVLDEGDWASDGETNDRLVADGAAFTGGGTFLMDVDFDAGNQADCSAATASDCVSLVGGSTPDGEDAPVTTIQLNAVGAAGGSLNRIVLVDLSGGETTPGAFVLADDSPTDQGLFSYRLDYDADAQQFVLNGQAGRGIYEFAQIGASAQNVWYSSVGSYFERQADLRDQLDVASDPGAWIKLTRTNTDREARASDFNLDHEQDTLNLIGGVDLVRGAGDGSAYVLGLSVGQLDSEVDFKVSDGATKLEGMSYGAYASLLAPSYFVDAIVQVNQLDVEQEGEWNPGGFGEGEVKSTGAQVEGGWRFPVNEGAYIEPLASLAYVRTSVDDLVLPGAAGVIDVQNAESLRGSVGVRISGDAAMGPLTVKLSGLGRLWNEFESENQTVLFSAGNELAMADDFNGAFSEVGVGLSFYSASRRVSGFINTGVKFKDQYLSSDTSFGFRLQW